MKCLAAITNGTTAVLLDATGRPTFRRSGIVAINKNGVWKVQCVNENTATKIAHETCMSLNFLLVYEIYKSIMYQSINKNSIFFL